ncbi:MAG: peptide chain release factor N(5)-glutamine methyltransferase [Saccharospirillum sp.]
MTTIKTALSTAREAGLDRLDAELLLAECLGRSRTWLFTWPEQTLAPEHWQRFQSLVARRAEGEPLAYLTGVREFWSLPIAVNDSTLIPRPDTETLVEVALSRIPHRSCRLADLGSGTGAIALALAHERPQWQVIAVEREPQAARLARGNAGHLRLAVAVIQGDWCESLADNSLDAIVSNPPYIDAADPHLNEGDVRFEPRSALVASQQGLADIRRIAGQALRVLRPGGWLLVEHGWTQAEAVRQWLASLGYEAVETVRDLGGNDRVSLGRLPAVNTLAE